MSNHFFIYEQCYFNLPTDLIFFICFLITDATFGDANITTLVDNFSEVLQRAGVVPEQVEVEWTSLKSCIYAE